MIIYMHSDATPSEVDRVVADLQRLGATVARSEESGRIVLRASVDDVLLGGSDWATQPGIERVAPEAAGGRRVGREHRSAGTVVVVADVEIGGGDLVLIAGPCAVETRSQTLETARQVAASGADILRGDAFKPRTSPYSFQGLGKAGLEIMAEARTETGLPFVAEVVDPRDVELVTGYADMLRIGTRNMSNHALLVEVGRQSLPVMLKRGRAATLEEWIDSAEYIHNAGNSQIVLVERGVRGFDGTARNALDLTAVPLVKERTHLPVLVDPSHAAGLSRLVAPLARAAVAVGADGVMVDVHPDPERALVDGAQALLPRDFDVLAPELRALHSAVPSDGR